MSKQTPSIQSFASPFPHEVYTPAGEGPFPAVFLTPLLGRMIFLEDLFFERIFARFFAANGVMAVILDRPIFTYNPAFGLHQIQHYLEQTLERNHSVYLFHLKNSPLDPEKTGTFGMSFGAIINALWASREPGFSAHVLAVPGGNIAEIFISSEDPLMRSHYEAARRQTGLSRQELKKELEKILTLEPLKCCEGIGQEKILMMLAFFDRVVPFRTGMALRKVLGSPETVFLPFGHYLSVLTVPWLKYRALSFYKRRWSLKKSGKL